MCAVSIGHPKQVFKIYAGSTKLSPFMTAMPSTKRFCEPAVGSALRMIVAVVILLHPIGR